jgi:hypothetical protein
MELTKTIRVKPGPFVPHQAAIAFVAVPDAHCEGVLEQGFALRPVKPSEGLHYAACSRNSTFTAS